MESMIKQTDIEAESRDAQEAGSPPAVNAAVEVGWGRLLFGQTFESAKALAETLSEEADGKRDIAIYVSEPHVALSYAPHHLFLDPSHTYRLRLDEKIEDGTPAGVSIRELHDAEEAEAINRIYLRLQMVPLPSGFALENAASDHLIYLVALDNDSGEVVGTVTGVDHVAAFGDPEAGSSLWCLAVDPQAPRPGVGEALVRALAEVMRARGRRFLDLSVMHDNLQAIALYEKLGFERIAAFTMKTRNPINEALYSAPAEAERELNPYAQIIVDEARRRGIMVEILDAEAGYFRLTLGARSIVCREALSELTTAVAMSRCDDKEVTLRLLRQAGLKVPEQHPAGTPDQNAAFLEKFASLVVKPASGEQGVGVFVDLRTPDEVEAAIKVARDKASRVLLEQFVTGQDLRIIVIGGQVVAAAVRRPPEILGDGQHSVRSLIEKQSRRREAATGGESRVPIDSETRRCVENAGYDLDSVLPEGQRLVVRKTANLHTGGTIHDVTDELHPALAEAAERAAAALDIPVVGFDFLVRAINRPDYVIIEANERPGLANHEPAPTAERFVDLLFPNTAMERA